MRKKLNLLFGLVLIISMIILIGCGGSGKTGEKNPYEGKWVAVSAQMMGMSVSIDETFGGAFEFEVKNNGKVSFSVGDTTGNGKWSVEDNQFILSIEGEEMVGIIGKDIISFDNMFEMGVKVIFAKDGTDAMDPALYLTEEENAVIGEWAAESVEELLGDGPQTSMEGVDNINDALHALCVNFFNKALEIVHCAVLGICCAIVLVCIRTAERAFFVLDANRMNRHKPNDVSTE